MDIDENEIIDMDYESSQTDNPSNDEHWFCFDDSIVTPVTRQHIQRHYGQNDCAYMLFYRQKNRCIPTKTSSDSKNYRRFFFLIKMFCFKETPYSVPEWLYNEIKEKNRILDEKR